MDGYQFFAIVLLSYLSLNSQIKCMSLVKNKDDDLSVKDLLIREGFEGLSSYYIKTPDNFTLNILRIMQKNRENMKPVLFLHGLTACSESFFVGKNRSLPIFFAKNGFDVWLLSRRGTHTSNHTVWNPLIDKQFWDISWEDMGTIDIPMGIDFVLDHSKHSKLILLGHSEGSTLILVLLSELPEYNDKVSLALHIAVSAYHTGCARSTVIHNLCKLEPILENLSDFFGVQTVSISPAIKEIFYEMCKYDVFKQMCIEASRILLQSSIQIDHIQHWSYVVKYAFCGGSMRELRHFAQVGNSGRFAKFDYGVEKNLKFYNSTINPAYNLSNIKSPTAIFNGESDLFVHRIDIERLVSELVNVETIHVEIMKEFSHIDVLLARDLEKYMFPKILRIVSKYKNID